MLQWTGIRVMDSSLTHKWTPGQSVKSKDKGFKGVYLGSGVRDLEV